MGETLTVTNFVALNILLTIDITYEHYTFDFILQFALDPDLYLEWRKKYNWFTLIGQRPHYAKSSAS